MANRSRSTSVSSFLAVGLVSMGLASCTPADSGDTGSGGRDGTGGATFIVGRLRTECFEIGIDIAIPGPQFRFEVCSLRNGNLNVAALVLDLHRAHLDAVYFHVGVGILHAQLAREVVEVNIFRPR